MPLTLTNEEMDKRCVMIKGTQYCRNVSKKAWQNLYLSYNPTVKLADLMNMHTYEMFYYLEGKGETDEDFEEMTDEELDALQVDSEEALKKLEEHRKTHKPEKPPKKKKEDAGKGEPGRAPKKQKMEKDEWYCFLNGGRTFLPAAHYWKWCIAKKQPERLDAYVMKKQSSTGKYIYTKCVKTQKKDDTGKDKDEYKWETYKEDTTEWVESQEYY